MITKIHPSAVLVIRQNCVWVLVEHEAADARRKEGK